MAAAKKVGNNCVAWPLRQGQMRVEGKTVIRQP